jgi:hypothetical protein
MKHAWLGIASILLFACGKQCPEETSPDGLVGNSVGCGNPVFAEMTVTDVNCVKCGAGIFPPTVFAIAFGKSLEVVLDSQNLVLADSVQSEVHLYHGMQVPVVSPLPLDSFAMEGFRLRLHSADLGPAIRTMGEEKAAIFPFSIRIRLRIFVQHLVFEQEGLLAGLGLDRNSGGFIATDKNPLLRTDRIKAIGDPSGYFQGLIDGWDSLATGTKSAFVYVQGSPYHAEIDPANGRFKLDALPMDSSFALRMALVPFQVPPSGKISLHILEAEPGSGPDRRFFPETSRDSVFLPESFR